ncbi:hypothetical protein Pth03_29490 [Planotetraspora thailandica]|uniref:Hemerythrin-like domain-containing protein n=1 Tax=Planotetraspora thailandica TaxID=487172 RepID=A0A8J3XW18_9ACTN|nr:hemerythrin domain-containing protein [Planotetraspora thailandica]GII54560.1 hypothetical protein Pth03_29490 [Planotetraspora thailandica]
MTNDAEPYFDGREMYMVHNMLRREFGLTPEAVRGVAAGDLDRARVVGAHITGLTTVLHHHHHGEDEFVWPALLERAAGEVKAIVQVMESQHQGIEKAVSEVDAAVESWRGGAAAESREALAVAVARLLPLLKEHLAVEEEHVVPLMEKHITAAEWNRIIQTAAAGVDPESLPLSFGMMMYEGDPEIIDLVISNMPPEARPVIRDLAGQAFAAHSELIHGTATPRRSTEL